MTKAIIGKKLGMTRIFDEQGNIIPVTLVLVGNNIVTQVKSIDKDNYIATQVGAFENKKINQPLAGHLKIANIKTKTLQEFEIKDLKVGDKLEIDQFEKGDIILAQAISKGKGFAGTIKRHNFTTGPKTHGSNNYRQPGSIGSMYPQRVIKGRRMAGHMGHELTTIKNLKIVNIDSENKVMMLGGAIPGNNGATVYISK